MAQSLRVTVVGDTRGYEAALARAGSVTGRFGGALAGMAKTAGLALGAGALGGLAVTLKVGAEEWAQHAKVAAQTAQVLKTTGGAANVTQKHVEDLAGAIMRKTGIDDEAVQASENLLLSFTGVRNEAGKGNAIFDRATKVIQDYAVRTGKSAPAAAQLFGKALNDISVGKIPTSIRGLGKLSDAQVKQMQTMVKAGDVAGAQGVLLGLLEQRVGGAAAAYGKTLPGQIDILRESFRNLAGEVFAGVVPSLQRLVSWTTANWPTIEAVFKAVFQAIGTAIDAGVAAINAIIPVGEAVVGWFQAHWTQISDITRQVFDTVKAIIMGAVSVIQAIWARFGDLILSQTRAVWAYIQSTIQNVLNVIRGIVNVVMGLIHGDWSRAWQGIQQIFGGIVGQILAVARLFTATMLNALQAAWRLMVTEMQAAWSVLRGIASSAFNGVVSAIRGAIGAALSAAASVGRAIVSGLTRGVANLVNGVVAAFTRVWGYITGAAAWLYGVALGVGTAIMHGIGDGIESAVGWVLDKLNAAKDKIKSVVTLGFGSTPYEWGAYAVGGPLMKGIAAGILASMPEAANATEKAKQEIKAKLQATDVIVAIQQAGRVIGLEHARAIAMGVLQGAPGIVGQVRAALQQGIAAARQAVLDARGSFASAFSQMAQQALDAFDQKWASWRAPAEGLLGKMQIEDSINQAQRAVDDANKQLEDARTQLAGATTPEEQATAVKAVEDATRAVGDAQRAQVENNLRLQADQQTTAHNTAMATQREHLSAQLLDLQRRLAAHPEAWRTTMAEVRRVLAENGVPMFTAGQRLASQFADGLRKGIAAVAAAARELAAALDAVAAGPGGGTGGGRPAGGGPTDRGRSAMTGRGTGLVVNVTVQGSVVAEQDLHESIYRELVRRSGRNTSLGLT